MRDIRKYEVFQLADRLVLDVYGLTSGFPKTETYGLTDQMRRAAASIPMNLTEGSARSGTREFAPLDAGCESVKKMLAKLLRAVSREPTCQRPLIRRRK